MEVSNAESREVQRTARDLVALSKLPALWIGYDPPRLADSLAEVVLSSVSLDVFLLRMYDRAGLIPIEIVRVTGKSVSAEATGRIVNALSSLPVGDGLDDIKVIPEPLGNGTLRVLTVSIGVEADGGFLVAGSKDPLFPTDENRLILNVTAGHAALVLQRRRAEEASQQTNTQVQLAVRGSNIGIWEVDMPDGQFRNGRVNFTNVWEQLGYARPPSPTDFATPMSLVHSDDSTRVIGAIDAYLAGDSVKLEVEHRARRSDGSYRWMLTRGVALRDAQGKAIRLIGSSIDISEHRQTEKALRLSEERFRRYFELGLIGMAITSPSKGCIEVNDETCRILGYSREEMLGRNWAEMTHPDDLAADLAQFERVMAGEIDRYTMDKRWIRKDRRVIDTTISVTAVRREDGSVDYFLALLQDVTERKRGQEAVERAREAAERASQIKDEFLATVSHELRTPLAAILLWSEILADKTLSLGDEAQALRAIRDSAHAQQQLIEDLLDVSRMLAGEMRLNLRLIDLMPVVQAAIDIVRPIAEAKRIEIDERLDQRAGRVRADASRCQQIALNLLNNAVKFTPEGGQIRVRLRRSLGMLEIVISDSGQGISAAFLPHIFERFRQADGGTTRRHGGLGLGLAIARQLVDLHGGKIRAESLGEGQGATFTVEFPIASGQAASLTASPPAFPPLAAWRIGPSSLLRGIRALVIEDDAASREVIRYLLARCQIEVTCLASAAEGLRAFAASLEGERFDVLVSDIAMPEMNGYELMRAVREMERRANIRVATPAVALTAYVRDQDRKEALAAGFNVHLNKPVVAATLIKAVADCVGRAIEDVDV
jgi:PAS domain S-box-containing protein